MTEQDQTASFSVLYGPWAVIAGASDGTGREFARQIARYGVNCLLIARRQSALATLADEISLNSGVQCVTASIDLASPTAYEEVIAAAAGREVGLYVSNAGGDPNGSKFLDRPVQAWTDLIQRNVVMTAKCCHFFGGPMRERRRGGLLLVNSYACYGGSSFMTTYSATKAFELCLAEGLWAELHPYGIDVLTMVLGATDTPAFRALLAQKQTAFPQDSASPADVASKALAQLSHGPVYNWGQTNDVAGHAPNSPDARRERIRLVDAASRAIHGD